MSKYVFDYKKLLLYPLLVLAGIILSLTVLVLCFIPILNHRLINEILMVKVDQDFISRNYYKKVR